MAEKYAVVSCHVERPLDDEVWRRYSALLRALPGGFPIASLIRPPDPATDETRREEEWLARAKEASRHGPLGLHTHWTAPDHARPTGGEPALRVREEIAWMRSNGLEPRVFCGGGWYFEPSVAATVARAGLRDCTATAFRQAYLDEGASRLAHAEPAIFDTAGGQLAELPATHSIGMLARALFRPLTAPLVHVYFHDTDLLDGRRRRTLSTALRLLRARRRPARLDTVAVPELPLIPYFEQ